MSVLVGKQAPDFTVPAVLGDGQIVDSFSFSEATSGKYAVVFFYPLDFTFVCPTELHAFQEKLAEFESRNVQLIGVSTDSWHSQVAWLNTPKTKGGIQGVTYPLAADFNKTIARDYDVLVEGLGAAYRGLFLIDKDGVVRHQVVNDLPLGRSVDEVLRMVDALQYFEANGEVCPANWTQGKQALKETREGLEVYFNEPVTVR